MINARELRIGNLLRCQYSNDIDVIDVGYMVDVLRGGIDLETDVEPIPLTEEWLLRGGFEKNSTSWTNWNRPNYSKEVRLGIQSKTIYYNGIEIKYVHQLQNLYYALTGRELEFSE